MLREQYCVREKHAKEVANEIKIKDDVNEAIEWLRFHKEKDWGIAEKLKAKRAAVARRGEFRYGEQSGRRSPPPALGVQIQGQ